VELQDHFRTTARGALDRARRLTLARRAAPALALALALAAALLVSPAPAGAEDPEGKNYVPEARIQIVLNKAYIKNDHDPGEGEMWFQVRLNCVQVILPCLGRPFINLDAYEKTFLASSGDTVWFNLVLPQSTEYMNPVWGIEVDSGYPLTSYQRYTVGIHMWEKDPFGGWDDLGDLEIEVKEENGWGIGAYPLWSGDNYQIGLEIRPSPLPDLRVSNIKILDLPGSAKKLVCMGVQNIGVVDAGPFELVLDIVSADGGAAASANVFAGGLRSGDGGDMCIEAVLPASGEHELRAAANPAGAVREFNHLNNFFRQPYAAPKSSVSPTATPSPAQALPDLTISAIRVNGHVPDGKDDCKEGRNAVAIVLKNAGAAKADFAVRLVVDGDDDEAKEKSVDGLDAGQEHQVRFDDVRLKQGERTLLAIADPKNAITESKEDDNDRSVTARCTDGD
jgi:hypothetical protein